MSSSACTTRDGSRRSTMHLASCLQIRISRSACANSSTPPSEVNRPPSNAAVTFLRPTAGNPIRAALSSRTAGVACGILCLAAELVSTPSFLQKVSALSHSRQPFGTLWCIREARQIRHIRGKGLSAGTQFGSSLGGFGQGIGLDLRYAHLRLVLVPKAAGGSFRWSMADGAWRCRWRVKQMNIMRLFKKSLRDDDLFNQAFDDIGGSPSARTIRNWSNAELHEQLVGNNLQAVARHVAECELRRRESWQTPAKYSLWAAILALVVSLSSIVLTLSAREHHLRANLPNFARCHPYGRVRLRSAISCQRNSRGKADNIKENSISAGCFGSTGDDPRIHCRTLLRQTEPALICAH